MLLKGTPDAGSAGELAAPTLPDRPRFHLVWARLALLSVNMFVNFSVMPLRVSTVTGLACSALAVLLGIEVLVERLARPGVPVGWASLLVAVLFFAGVQLVMLGLLGEYLGRLFLAENQTPQFVVREVVEMDRLPQAMPLLATAFAPSSRESEGHRT